MLADAQLPDRRHGLPRRNQILQKLPIPGSGVGLMRKLFLNRVKNLIPVIHPNASKIFLDTLSKSDLEHVHIFAYASRLDNEFHETLQAPGKLVKRTQSREHRTGAI
jgi:hypothetical protein